jgi:integrase
LARARGCARRLAGRSGPCPTELRAGPIRHAEVEALDAQRADGARGRGRARPLFKASSRQADDDLVFADPHTPDPLDKAAILRRYRKALKAAKLDEAHRFHDLRHTFGTRMAAAGVSMRTLQQWMGHRDIETTQCYADYAPIPHEAAIVEAALGQESPVERAEVS